MSKNCLFVHKVCLHMYGKNSVKYKSTEIYNKLQRTLNFKVLDQSRPKTKGLINEYSWKYTIITNKTQTYFNYRPAIYHLLSFILYSLYTFLYMLYIHYIILPLLSLLFLVLFFSFSFFFSVYIFSSFPCALFFTGCGIFEYNELHMKKYWDFTWCPWHKRKLDFWADSCFCIQEYT